MQTRMLAVRGGLFNTEVLEAGSGSPLLFLHGEYGLEPNDFHAELAKHFHVVAPRHPGFGESTGTEHLLDLHDLLYYYLDTLDALNLRNLPVVAQGLGGMFAAELAVLQPERFTKMALIAPYGVWNADDPVYDIFATTPKELAERLFFDPTQPGAKAISEAPDEQERFIAFMVDRAKSMATSAKYLWPIPNRGLDKRSHRISTPTLLVWGEADRIIPPSYAKAYQKLIPHAQIAMVPKASHLPDVEQPQALAKTVLDFVK